MAEHIPAAHLDNLMQTLTNAPIVAMTHGVSSQAGHHHVNNQPSEYWIKAFDERGYSLSIDNEHFREIAREDAPGAYFASAGHVFLKRG
ncbi:hypothetical protein [Breoghania sp.]|uniref:hypothetical protein n=1 Tax=Breoghania sp. TaxID=2065378 RepID=UPI002620C094|nr:hypothetical protein [Breoghania sp.]